MRATNCCIHALRQVGILDVTGPSSAPTIGIVVVAYNAASTLAATLDRIPAEVLPRIAEVIISDDASHDDTFEHGPALGRQRADACGRPSSGTPRTSATAATRRPPTALAIEHGLDIVVLLHGDGQYAPECLPDMVAPFERRRRRRGLRLADDGQGRRHGRAACRCTSGSATASSPRSRTAMLGTELTEFHSGYRAYASTTLSAIPFEANSDGFDFDTQIIAQLVHAGGRIVEIPIPTYYGDEICYVNGMKYARDVVRDVVEFKLATKGFGTQEWVPTPERVRVQGGRRLLARGRCSRCSARCRRRGSSTSAAPAACSPSGPAPPGTT